MIFKLGLASALLLHVTVAHLAKREVKPLSLRVGLASTDSRPDLDGLGGSRGVLERQLLEVTCSACSERLTKREPFICCRCIKETAACNNDIGRC